MKALITGATGQVGRALIDNAPPGWVCVAPTRDRLDLLDPLAIEKAVCHLRPDLVINAAAFTAVDRAESEQVPAFAINAQAVRVMAAALADTGGHLLQISTDFVFDGATSIAYRPDAERNPLSVYGLSKALGEDFAGPAACIVRTSWVYAAGGKNFVRTMLNLMREGRTIRVVSDQIGAPTWANGLACALWSLAQKRVSGIFHHRDAGMASWHDFAVAIGEEARAIGILERPPSIVPIATADYPTPAKRPRYSVLDDSETRRLIGDTPAPWRENLRKMLREELSIG